MRQYKKKFLLFFLVLFARAEFIFSQQGDSCTTALPISYSPEGMMQVSFENREYVWLMISTDTPGVELEISPDSLSDYANVESIDLYEGGDCSSKTILWSRKYVNTDSLQIDRTIHFFLTEAGFNYFLKVNRLAGYGNGFRINIIPEDVMAGCIPPCPNIINDPSFSYYNTSCVNDANDEECPNPFNQGCVCKWRATHGSPILTSNSATMGYEDNTNTGEGIYQELINNVVPSRNYFISFRYIAYSPHGNIDLHAQFTNANFNAGTCFESLPPPGWDIPGTPVVVNSNAWHTYATCFSPNAVYSKIRFYPITTDGYKEWVGIDDITLIELDATIPNRGITCNQSTTLSPPCPSTDSRIQYLWNTGETTASITVSPIVTTIYTLTVSVVINNQTLCSYNIPVTVYVSPLPNAVLTTGNTTICDPGQSQPYCFTVNGALQYNFTVNPPNPSTINGNCINVQWNNTAASCGTIEVAAIANACTTTTSFQCCIPCQGNPSNFTWCDETASSILNDPQYASYITLGNVFKTPPGKWVTIHGIFTVDVPFIFDNSDVRFGPDAKIDVGYSKTFEVKNGCHLHSCDGIHMWDGIYTHYVVSKIYIHDGNNLIEDAKNAISSDFGGNFEINATTFKNNYIGILVNTIWSHHPGKVYGCKFFGTGSLLSPYNTYCTLTYPTCGIKIIGVKEMDIGEPSYYSTYGRNYFHDMLTGIYSFSSGMNIYTSEFNYMFDPPGNCSQAQGHGIYATGSTGFYEVINVGNQAVNEKCIFNSCKYGIEEKYNFSGKIQYNEFSNCDYPITNLYSNKYYNLVKGNVMNNFRRGIYFLDAINQLTYGLEIHENIFNPGISSFNPSTYGKEAINVSNSISTSTNLWAIGNVITYSQVGIFTRNVWEPCVIQSNSIYFDISPANVTALGAHHGIQCENDNGLTVADNIIQWRNQSSVPSGFINLMNGITINYSSNTVGTSGGITENKIGPYPAANTGSTYGMGSGINISSECIGLTLVCNKMSRCEEGVTFNQADLGHQGYYDQHQNWYTNGNTFKYTPAQGGSYRIGGSVIQKVDWGYINANEDPHPFLFGTIEPHIAIYGAYQCLPPSPFLEEQRDDNFGILISEDNQDINPDYSGYEEKLEYSAKEKFYSMVKEDSSILIAGVPADADFAALFEDLEISNIAKIQDIKTSFDSLDYQTASQKLSTLIDSNLIEQNKKTVLQVYLQSLNSESPLDSSQIALLEPISLLHPLIGGEGVFWACAMLDKPVNNILPSLRKAKPHSFTNDIENLSFNIYPNPAKNVLHFKYNSKVQLSLIITDVAGKIIFDDLLSSEQNVEDVNTSAIDAGTYLLKLMNRNEVVYSEKLIIIK